MQSGSCAFSLHRACLALLLTLATAGFAAEADPLTAPYPEERCSSCAGWNEPVEPFRIYGNTWYVGTAGLSSILLSSEQGHVLIDGGLPDSAPLILANIARLGFDPADIRLLLNSHAHFDHAAGLAALQRASGARVAASPASAAMLEAGTSLPGDPQFGALEDFPPLAQVQLLEDGEVLQQGPLELQAHFTGGHTPGGTSWSWRSCEEGRCLDLVYADSVSAVSAQGFRFSDSGDYPAVLADFERSFTLLENLPCDILLAPHPWVVDLFERAGQGGASLVDPDACSEYAADGRDALEQRLQREAGAGAAATGAQ